ncbi:MAG: nucleotidyltransferase family protein [Gammaproteobacteria bacterium]
MKVMILAAGRGQRMGHLTDELPKPMLPVAGKPLIERLIERLADTGLTQLVINIAWQGDIIRDHFSDGHRWGVQIRWSDEGHSPIGTASGIRRALPLLGQQPFLLINSDVICDVDFRRFAEYPLQASRAHLLMVDNPDHHPQGDFDVDEGRLVCAGGERLTYSGIGLFEPALIAHSTDAALGPIIRTAIERGDSITARHHRGQWLDVGTPERLRLAQTDLS